jgi:uncharacterized membrane protein
MQVKFNTPHIILWGRVLSLWLMYVGFCVIVGWSLHPRLDEVLFAVFLPAFVIVPYIVICLAVAALRLWLVGDHGRARPFGRSILTHEGVEDGPRGGDHGTPREITSVGTGRM